MFLRGNRIGGKAKERNYHRPKDTVMCNCDFSHHKIASHITQGEGPVALQRTDMRCADIGNRRLGIAIQRVIDM